MKRILSLWLIFIFSSVFVLAQEQFVPDKGQEGALSGQDEKKDDPEKARQDKIKKYEDLLKDSTKHEGPFTLYTKVKDGKTDTYWELDASLLGKYWYLEATFRTGASAFVVTSGFPLQAYTGGWGTVDAFRFERKGDQIWLWIPNLNYRWKKNDPLAIANERAYPEAVLADYKIEAEHPDTGKLIIKINDLFLGGLYDLTQMLTMMLGRPYQLDRDKSGVTEINAFPENHVIRTRLFFTSSRTAGGGIEALLATLMGGQSQLADPRSLPLEITYLLYPQPDSDYMPRLSDPRVGYFTTDYYDSTRFMQMDRTQRLITRWNLKKKDPSAELSEPVKPIVWYIDDTVPEKWREACAEGILRWNKAFERLGYKNAIQVRMKPKDADWDSSDMRFNVLRFTTSPEAGYAVALFRTDPFTGEIINSAINCDANIVFFAGLEYDWLTDPARGNWEGAAAKLLRPTNSDKRVQNKSLPQGWQVVGCDMAHYKMKDAALGLHALQLIHDKIESKDRYIHEFLADIVSHEMGHCLGLRHNFVASTHLTLQQMANPAITENEGISASVMDYVPVNMAAVSRGKGHYYTPTIGAYDIFAIEYGYADVLGTTPEDQYKHLKKIASKGSLPGHAYMTDENADMFDPFVVRFDNAKNPLDNADLTISVAKQLLREADRKLPLMGQPFSDLERAVRIGIVTTFSQCLQSANFVGGIHGRRNFRGDPDEKPTLEPVNPSLQRQALHIIVKQLFSEDSIPLSERMLVNLTSNMNTGTYSDAPIKDIISNGQAMVLVNILSADTTDRVANNAFKLQHQKDIFTLSELYGTVVGKIFSEVGTGRTIGVLRRDLQRFTTEALIIQATSPSGRIQEDVRVITWDILERLHVRLKNAKSNDDMTQLHMRDLARRIARVLESKVTIPR